MASLFLCLVFVMLSVSFLAEGRIGFVEEDLEFERQLRVLNKLPVRSFKNEDGSAIDCIDINKQPAFDHPLLRNHKIQLQPSSWPKQMLTAKSESVKTGRRNRIDCPPTTVPIRRTTKEDLIRAKSFPRSHPSSAHSSVSIEPGYYQSVAVTASDSSIQYSGFNGTFSVHNETVTPNQLSGAGVWLANKQEDEIEFINFGWIVYPKLYGDNKTRTIASWAGKNGTGCTNSRCHTLGFVQIDSKHSLGEAISCPSTYDGVQCLLQISIYQDQVTGNWWVEQKIGNEGPYCIGYWPKSLFANLAEYATELRYGGEVFVSADEPPPTMGSGHFVPPDTLKTASVVEVQPIFKTTPPHNPVVYINLGHPCYPATSLEGEDIFPIMYGGPDATSCETLN